MTERKLKLIVQAVTVFAIMVVCAMIIGLTVQFVTLSKLKREQRSLNKTLSYLEDYSCDVNSQLDYYNNSQALEDMYRSQGYSKDSDIRFGK